MREYWWAYLVVAVAICLIWWGIFSQLDRVEDNQRLTICVYNSTCDTQKLQTHLAQCLPTLTHQEIRELYVDDLTLQIDTGNGKQLLIMQLLQADMAILPEKMLEQMRVQDYFLPLPQQLPLPENAQLYNCDGVTYGVLVGGGAQKHPFDAFCGEEEQYWLFLSASSCNLGGLNERGTQEDDAALVIWEYLLKEGNP